MVVNLRGTGGSGKSYIVREMMRRCVTAAPEHVTGRRRPIGYRCTTPAGRTLYVPGHYDTACGGCDTIKTPGEVYEIVTREAERGSDVLFEGIIVQDEWRRCAALAERFEVAVIVLDVPMELCLASIQSRRDARGDGRPLNPTNTVNRARRLEATVRKLALVGVDARWLSRDAALARCAQLLGLSEAPAAEEEDDGFRLV